LELNEPIRFLLILGTNIFGIYAFYKVLQGIYWYLQDQTRKDEF